MKIKHCGTRQLVVVGLIAALATAGCSSSSKSGPAASAAVGNATYTIGVITDLTGAGADTGTSYPLGIKAGIGEAGKQGYRIKFVEADTTTSPGGALAAAQRLVEQDHVYAVFLNSLVGFGAAQYLTAHNVPVVGASVDGSEWTTSRNMFSVLGYENYAAVQTTYGEFLKSRGVTNLASVGYGIEPSSGEVAKSWSLSAQHAGIKVGYLNTNFPFGSTNVGPMVLAMKDAGVNGLVTAIVTNSTFSIIQGLREQGVDLKAAIPPTGYGGDLTQGGASAQQDAQGVYFLSPMEPVEMNTSATRRFQTDLSTYADVKGEPTLSEYLGYTAVDAFAHGLKAAGSNPTQESLIAAMLGITNYNAAGLFGTHSVSFSMSDRGKAANADNCLWFTRYQGTTFHLISGADPICGQTIPGLTVPGK